MHPRSMSDEPNRALPLTETPSGDGSSDDGPPTEADIRALVDSFYDVVCRDELLGPVFTRHITDWSLHLPKMYDFWSSIVLHSGRYSGRPIDAHLRLSELTPLHFERWLALWDATVARVIDAPARDLFTQAAVRMAASMSIRIFGRGAPG